MFEDTDKKKLYWLIDQFLLGKVNIWEFSDEYHTCYDVEFDLDCLTEKEYKLFSNLSLIVGRFSPYKTDHIAHPGFFYTEKEIRKKAAEIKEQLKDTWPSFKDKQSQDQCSDFPANWTREQVIRSIFDAYDDFLKSSLPDSLEPSGVHSAIGSMFNHVKIKMFVTKNGRLTTAYPTFWR